jgi:hypothetical protein
MFASFFFLTWTTYMSHICEFGGYHISKIFLRELRRGVSTHMLPDLQHVLRHLLHKILSQILTKTFKLMKRLSTLRIMSILIGVWSRVSKMPEDGHPAGRPTLNRP